MEKPASTSPSNETVGYLHICTADSCAWFMEDDKHWLVCESVLLASAITLERSIEVAPMLIARMARGGVHVVGTTFVVADNKTLTPEMKDLLRID